jgi:hypothetical protein
LLHKDKVGQSAGQERVLGINSAQDRVGCFCAARAPAV